MGRKLLGGCKRATWRLPSLPMQEAREPSWMKARHCPLLLPFEQSTKLSSDSCLSSSMGIAGLRLLFSRKAECGTVTPAQEGGDMAAFSSSSCFHSRVAAKVTFATTEDVHKRSYFSRTAGKSEMAIVRKTEQNLPIKKQTNHKLLNQKTTKSKIKKKIKREKKDCLYSVLSICLPVPYLGWLYSGRFRPWISSVALLETIWIWLKTLVLQFLFTKLSCSQITQVMICNEG